MSNCVAKQAIANARPTVRLETMQLKVILSEKLIRQSPSISREMIIFAITLNVKRRNISFPCGNNSFQTTGLLSITIENDRFFFTLDYSCEMYIDGDQYPEIIETELMNITHRHSTYFE